MRSFDFRAQIALLMSEDLYVSRQEIIHTFGFSATLVKELGQPDFVKANPRWGYTYYYDLGRVERFAEEHARRIRRILTLRPRRRASVHDAVQRRRQETIRWSETVPIHLESIPPYCLAAARRYFAPEAVTHDRFLLYLRVTCTDYLQLVQQAARRFGAADARLTLRLRANHLIEAALRRQGIDIPR